MNASGDKQRLAISFSGGRTSAVMTKRLVERHKDSKIITVNFANTGCEHPATLDFIDRCDREFGLNVVWLEAVIDPRPGKGIRHKVVTYDTASRMGEPFRAYIAKYGIPNSATPQCTTKLKEVVLNSYRHRELGWRGGKYPNYFTAIGIRADEMRRMDDKREAKRFIYPLVESGTVKHDIIMEVRSWGFDLMLPGEHYGNCVWCWKKSNRKLLTLAKESPWVFDFPLEMDRLYGGFKLTEASTSPDGRRHFFRGHRSTMDILELAKGNFEPFKDAYNVFDPDMDIESGCGAESCEVGAKDK